MDRHDTLGQRVERAIEMLVMNRKKNLMEYSRWEVE